MLREIAKALFVSRAWILSIAFLAAVWGIVESSEPFQSCMKEQHSNSTPENFEKSIPSLSVTFDIYRICLGHFTHDNAEAIIAAFTILLALSTIFLWVATRDLVRGTEKTAQAQLRAYVHYGACRWISHADRADGHIFWRIRPRWVNGGATPTSRLHVYAHYELLDEELPTSYSFVEDPLQQPVPTTIAPHGIAESVPRDIDGTDLVAVSERRKHLYIWGIARYHDVLPGTRGHITKFCVYATNISGDPMRQWHATDNPVEIMFATYHRHNCADDDCNKEV